MSSVGAGAYIDGVRAKTKTALRNALRTAPDTVTFDVTDAFGEYAGKTLRASALPAGVAVQVCGPDPYTKRSWYARVDVGGQANAVRIAA